MNKSIGAIQGILIVASVALISLNVVPRPVAVAIGAVMLLATGWEKSWASCVAALVLFGLPFLAAVGSLVGVSPTSMVMATTFLLALYALRIVITEAVKGEDRRNTAKFVVWWIFFQLIYVIQFILGPNTDHATFLLQYLLVYGNFNAIGAIVVARRPPSIPNVLSIGTLLFSFYFPVWGISILGVSSLADASIGLRGMEGFNSIGTARMSGVLTVFALCTYIFCEQRLRNAPYILAALAIGAPLTFYSFTRQVYVAIVLTVAAAFIYKAIKGGGRKSDKSQAIALASFLTFFTLILYKAYSILMQSKGNRVVEAGMEINRTGIWQETWHLILDNPILGLGVGGFQQNAVALWPHNWILEAWVELGIMGLFIAVLPLIAIGKSVLASYKSWNSIWVFLGIYYVIVIQVSGDIPRNMEFLFSAGMVMCMSSFKNEERKATLGFGPWKPKANLNYV